MDADGQQPINTGDGEGLAQELINRLGTLEGQLKKAHLAIAKVERRRSIERLLAGQQVKDVFAAADLIEREDTGEGEVSQLVKDLRRSKPGLFKGEPSGTSVPTGEGLRDPQLVVLRERARQGDRASLLLYLRARRDKS